MPDDTFVSQLDWDFPRFSACAAQCLSRPAIQRSLLGQIRRRGTLLTRGSRRIPKHSRRSTRRTL